MAGSSEIFKRYEKKYLLSPEQYRKLMIIAGEHLTPDKYARSLVCSVYFDTPDDLLIRRSMEKPPYKEKLRIRSYGVPDNGSTVFAELKRKYDGVVYKRRVQMDYTCAKRYFYEHEPFKNENQITREIDWFLNFYPNLAASMIISYEREAFTDKEDKRLRITFDKNMLWRDTDLFLDNGVFGSDLLKKGNALMEIKTTAAIPLWLSELLSHLEIYPTSFSKYGRAYAEKRKERGGIYCA